MSGNGDENVEQAIVVEKVDSAIRWINFSPVDNAIGQPNSDLAGGQKHPTLNIQGRMMLKVMPGKIEEGSMFLIIFIDSR